MVKRYQTQYLLSFLMIYHFFFANGVIHLKLHELPIHLVDHIQEGAGANTSIVSNYQNSLYFVQLQFGSNKQPMNLVCDTGSSWVWVQSTSLSSETFGTTKFNCSASSTCINTGTPEGVAYSSSGSGVNGTMGNDTISFSNGMKVKHSFIIATTSNSMSGMKADGFWGMNHYTANVPTLMDDLKAQGVISHKSFAIFLSNNPNSGQVTTDSFLTIGGYDASILGDNQFTTINVVNNYNFWEFNFTGMLIGNNTATLNGSKCILDTGYPYMSIGQYDFPTILAAFQNVSSTCAATGSRGTIQCTCAAAKDMASYPNLTFKLGYGTVATLPVQASSFGSFANGQCNFGININTGSTVTRFGMNFLRNWYLYFDIDNMAVSFGQPSSQINANITSTPDGLSSTAKAGIIAGAVFGAILLIAVVFYFMRRHRLKEKKMPTIQSPTTKSRRANNTTENLAVNTTESNDSIHVVV
jgi:hypothetical protein